LTGRHFEQVLNLEDELTTGATLETLIEALALCARRFFNQALAHLRSPAHRRRQVATSVVPSLEITVIDLLKCDWIAENGQDDTLAVTLCDPLAFGVILRDKAPDKARTAIVNVQAEALDIVGECVDVPLAALAMLRNDRWPQVQQTTRSPNTVDGHVIRARLERGKKLTETHYYLYNAARRFEGGAIITAQPATMSIAKRLATVLRSHSQKVDSVEVSGR
jgi:hypothetical protein